jgi:uncharacterized iron-regulated membrane protein
MGQELTLWQRWVQRPRILRIRKVVFQIHLWMGLGVGIYVLAISISGGAIVYRPELTRMFSRKTVVKAETRAPDDFAGTDTTRAASLPNLRSG